METGVMANDMNCWVSLHIVPPPTSQDTLHERPQTSWRLIKSINVHTAKIFASDIYQYVICIEKIVNLISITFILDLIPG